MSRQLFLGNLNYRATAQQIRDVFVTLGIQVGDVRIPRGEDDANKGFAFVDISDDETRSTEAIIDEVAGVELCGRPLRVDEAQPRPQPAHASGRGRRTGAGDAPFRDTHGQADRASRSKRKRRRGSSRGPDDNFGW